MTLTWHIFRKDLVRLSVPLALWTALMAAKITFYASISGVFGAPSIDWLGRMMNPPELALRSLVEPMVAFILVGWMVYEDPMVGADAFWTTRPISGTRLLAAKFGGACLLFVALPVLINVPWWVACGFGAQQIVNAALPMAVEYAIVVIVGMAAASATDAFPRFFLWTIAGIAALLAIHFTVSECLGNGIGFKTTDEMGAGQFLTRALFFGSCLLAVSAEIILHQYLPRRTRHILVGLMVATILASAAICSSSLNLFSEQGLWGHKPDADVASMDSPTKDFTIEIPQGAQAGTYYNGSMVVPMTFHGLKDNEAVFLPTFAEWRIGGKLVWRIGGWAGGSQYRMLDDRMHRMLGIATGSNDYTTENVFSFPRELARRISSEPAAFHADIRPDLLEGRLAADLTLRNQVFRHGDGSFTVSGLTRTPTTVGIVMTNRFEGINFAERFEVFWPHAVTLALANRAEKIMLTGKQEDLGPWALQLNMVQVTSQKISFTFPGDSAWVDGAELVAFDFVGGHRAKRTLDMDPFKFTMRNIPKAATPRKH
jgi:hypothetical protein